MAELKTKANNASVAKFLAKIPEAGKRKDAQTIMKLMKEVMGEKPRMWGDSIVGFGKYHYKSERSTQEGDWPLTGFSPRKQNLTVYIMPGFDEYKDLLKKLGPHKISGGSCIYLKSLEGVNLTVLKTIVRKSVAAMRKRYNA